MELATQSQFVSHKVTMIFVFNSGMKSTEIQFVAIRIYLYFFLLQRSAAGEGMGSK